MISFINALLSPEAPFIRYALLAGLLSSLSFGVIGSFVVVKRMTYIAGSLSHTALAGIGLALWLSITFEITILSPIMGALLASVLSGMIVSYSIVKKDERTDTILGAIWAVGMSIGFIFIYLTPDYVDPMSYLFGNILLIAKKDLWLIAALNSLVIFFSVLFYNQFLSVFFDEEFACTRGLQTEKYQLLFILLVSLTVILLLTVVGIVMVIALLTIPPAIANVFVKRMKHLIFLSIFLNAFILTFGLYISYILELPTGSVTVLFAGVLYFLVKGGSIFLQK